MKSFILLMNLCLLSTGFAAGKVMSEEEVAKIVEREMSAKSRYGKFAPDLNNFEVDRSEDNNNFHNDKGTDPQGNVAWKGKSRFIPFGVDGSDLVKIAAASTAAVIFFANDDEVMNFVQSNQSQMTQKVAFFGEGFGSEWPMYAAAGGYILGVITKNDGTKRYALMGAKTMLISGLAVQVLKNMFHRTRPNSAKDAYEFAGPNASFGSDVSFPSGHTTVAFTVATYIAETNKHRGPLIPILAYSAAAIGAWSRVHDKAHWASDVVIGALLGHLITKNVLNSDSAEKGLLITPSVDLNGNFFINVLYTGKPKSGVENCGEGLPKREKIHACIDALFEASPY